jgi:site-specific DNA recombinase
LVPAVSYLRRSSDSDSQETSVPEQRATVLKFAAERGYRVLREYVDDAVSGDDTERRHGFLRMIADASALGDFEAVLCWDRARFGRFDSLEYGYYVHPLRKAGVCLVTVLDGVTDWNDVSGRIVAGVTQEGKHQQLLDHSANVVRGHMAAASNGGWLGSAPYAYRIEGPKKRKRLVVSDPVKVGVVRRIFREFVEEGRSMGNIADRLNADGYPAPHGPGRWRSGTVKTVLENPTYTGDYAGLRSSYAKYHRAKGGRVERVGRRPNQTLHNPKEDWVIVRDTHEAIIDRDTFARAQTILARGKTGRPSRDPDKNPYVLSGLLRCGRCGAVMHGLTTSRHRYYECGKRHYDTPKDPTTCLGTTVREDTFYAPWVST